MAEEICVKELDQKGIFVLTSQGYDNALEVCTYDEYSNIRSFLIYWQNLFGKFKIRMIGLILILNRMIHLNNLYCLILYCLILKCWSSLNGGGKKANVKTENKELVIEKNSELPDSSNFQRKSLKNNKKFISFFF